MTALTAMTTFQTRRRSSQERTAGRTSMATPVCESATTPMTAVVGHMWLKSIARVATIDRG
jgi:hypothetical protein